MYNVFHSNPDYIRMYHFYIVHALHILDHKVSDHISLPSNRRDIWEKIFIFFTFWL